MSEDMAAPQVFGMGNMDDRDALLAANASFYAAFGAGDFTAMSALKPASLNHRNIW